MQLNENQIVQLAEALKTTADVIQSEGGLDSVITKYKQEYKVFTDPELATLRANVASDSIKNLTDSKDIPKPIYDRVKGTVLEMKERDVAKKYGVNEYKNFDDLLEKIIETKTANNGDGEKDQLIKQLRDKVRNDEAEWTKKVGDAKSETDNYIISTQLDSAISNIPIDADGETLANQRDILKTMFSSNYQLKRENNNIVVSDKQGNILKTNTLEPQPLSDVLSAFAPKYVKIKKSPEGGRGDSSSSNSPGAGSYHNIKTMADFNDLAGRKGIKPNSVEAAKLLQEVRAANPNFNS